MCRLDEMLCIFLDKMLCSTTVNLTLTLLMKYFVLYLTTIALTFSNGVCYSFQVHTLYTVT